MLEGFAYTGTPSRHSILAVLRDVFLKENGQPYSAGVVRELSYDAIARAHDMNKDSVKM